MSFAIHYRPRSRPVAPKLPPSDAEDALYELADAGAWAEVTIDEYTLELHHHCLVELARACRSLLEALAAGSTSAEDEQLRDGLAVPNAGAQLHSWLFPCFMSSIPAIVFAIGEGETCVYTRTLAESRGMPLVALAGRDRTDPACSPTTQVRDEARTFLAASLADACAAFPQTEDDPSYRRYLRPAPGG